MGYELSPSDERGDWYVLAANINPWPTSVWQSLRYSVLRVGPDPGHPKERKWSAGINLGEYKLHASAHEFTVSYIGGTFHPGLLTRVHVERYAERAHEWVRVAPWAVWPLDFLDEWSQMDWKVASRYVAGTGVSAARELHRQFSARQAGEGYPEVVFVQPCPGGSRWQIGLEFFSGEELEARTFVEIHRKGEDFILARVAARRPPGCPGDGLADIRGPMSLP